MTAQWTLLLNIVSEVHYLNVGSHQHNFPSQHILNMFLSTLLLNILTFGIICRLWIRANICPCQGYIILNCGKHATKTTLICMIGHQICNYGAKTFYFGYCLFLGIGAGGGVDVRSTLCYGGGMNEQPESWTTDNTFELVLMASSKINMVANGDVVHYQDNGGVNYGQPLFNLLKKN
ncbi:hypothetical protein ACJX0J_022909, partial [Zea mays]